MIGKKVLKTKDGKVFRQFIIKAVEGRKMSTKFYLTLPSNANAITYPENNPSKFKVKLPKEIRLPESDWEVALASITFPSTLDTVIRNDVNYQLLLGANFICGFMLDMKDIKESDGDAVGYKSYFLHGSQMKCEFTKGLFTPSNGVDFWNRMIAALNTRMHSRFPRRQLFNAR